MCNDCIIVFARHPTPGRVKTRLAAGVGDQGSSQFYKSCAERIIERCTRVPGAACCVSFSSTDEADKIATWLAPLSCPHLTLFPQVQSDNLGDRLYHALHQAIDNGHRRAVVVGTDIPDLSPTILQQALHKLETHDIVFGPAQDGGYYLVGLKASPARELFQNISWSTSDVLQQSMDAARQCGLSVAPIDALPALRDIDTVSDLREWIEVVKEQSPDDSLLTLAIDVAARAKKQKDS